MELYALAVNLGDFLYVLAVVLAHHDVRDAGTLGSENLLLYSAYRQNLTAQSYLSRHSCVFANLTLGKSRSYGGGDSNTC